MVEPLVVPRSDHALSRREIDPDALKVLYRLRQYNHTAYLVGGGVRDLLLARRPKDFDIGTSAHPYEVKRLFRNCWIIGRRFRLAHVRFGTKVVEVATFRRQLTEADLAQHPSADDAGGPHGEARPPHERLIHRDNTFGTPEEDAFRRDFTVNALFYDIATCSVIDYVGGLEDLQARSIRCIGDPDVRLPEDPVRMVRAIALAARLDFTIDPPTHTAIERHRALIARSSPPRLLEEYYKILRGGSAERAFRGLASVGLLRHLSPELEKAGPELWASLQRLDEYRQRFPDAPETLTNAVLLASLLVPFGRFERRADREAGPPRVALGVLPLARRDIEHVRHILALQRRLTDPRLTDRARHALARRSAFEDAVTWLEIHGTDRERIEHLRELSAGAPATGDDEHDQAQRRRRRRRRRRRPGRPAGPGRLEM
jgi:poly(A) polymerase